MQSKRKLLRTPEAPDCLCKTRSSQSRANDRILTDPNDNQFSGTVIGCAPLDRAWPLLHHKRKIQMTKIAAHTSAAPEDGAPVDAEKRNNNKHKTVG
jgi:hypothetical protein